MRVLALLAAVALAACSSAPQVFSPTPSPTHEPNVLKVSALLDLSGPRAPSGDPQRDAMQLWLDQAGSRPTPHIQLRVKFVDVAGSDAKALLELRRAIVEDHADAIVVGASIPLDTEFTKAAEVAGVSVLVTLPMADPATLSGGRWVFALAPSPDMVERQIVLDIVNRGVPAPALLVTDESRAAGAERIAFLAALDRVQLVKPTAVALASTDSASRIRAGAAVAKSVVLLGPATVYGDAIRAMPVTTTSPRVYLSWLTETADVTNLREANALVVWPGSRNLAPLSVPQRPGLRASFLQAFTDRHGAPSTLAAAAYDALVLLDAAAATTLSPFPPERLRLSLEAGTVDGVATLYTFTGARHLGFPQGDVAILRWDPLRAAPVQVPLLAPPVRDTQ